MLSRLMAILMCCQVLVCPVLCIDCCASNDDQGRVQTADRCDCCSSACSRSNRDNQPNVPCQPSPCDPTSESCNCFCGGAVAPHADELLIFDAICLAYVDCFLSEPNLVSQSKSQLFQFNCECDAKLSGRGLLRAHCVLLI